jgi:hypothetical protein
MNPKFVPRDILWLHFHTDRPWLPDFECLLDLKNSELSNFEQFSRINFTGVLKDNLWLRFFTPATIKFKHYIDVR